MCALRELYDGTYSIDDLADMHEILDLKEAMKANSKKAGE